MRFLNNRGVVTVFLILILPAVLLSGLVLTDAAVLLTGTDMAEEAVKSSAYAVLGQYSSYLKDEYDIYGYCMTEYEAKEIAGEIIKQSLGNPKLYDFKIEDIEICFAGSLCEPMVMKDAVLSVAADDFFENTINEFIERFNVFKGFSGAADVIKLKMEVDEAVRRFSEAGELLTDLVNGNDSIECYINSFNNFTGLEISADKLSEIISDMKNLKSEIDDLKRIIAHGETEDAGELNLMEEALGALRETAAEIYYSEMESILTGLREANSRALGYIKTMIEEKANINALSQLITKKINESDTLPEYIKEMLLQVSDVIKDVENEAFGLVFDIVEEKINENISILSGAAVYVENEIDGILNKDKISVSDTIAGYNMDIAFSFSKSSPAGKEEDRRSFFEELGKRVLEKRTGRDVEVEDQAVLPSSVCDLSKENCLFEVSVTGESTGGAASGITGFERESAPVLVSMFDSLAMNEYLLNHLATETSENISGRFFKNEIEYVLWGAGSQNLNRFYTKSALMGTRFALNAIHVYTDSSKKIKADAIAAATAGWWTMGAGIPVMSNLVRCAWAIAEAGCDVGRLCDGGSTAIVKRKADWVTDIGIKSAGLKSPDFLCMDYEDYMRIYLLMLSDEKRMIRLADIIQLNSTGSFDILNTYTEVSVRAVISFRSITGGRHEKTIEISRQYQGDGIS